MSDIPAYATPATPPNNPNPNYNYYPPQPQLQQPSPPTQLPPQQRRQSRFARRTTPSQLDTTFSIQYTFIKENNGSVTVYQQPSRDQKYSIITPTSVNPQVSIVNMQTSEIFWGAKVMNSSDVSGSDGTKIKPTANWECINQLKEKRTGKKQQRTLIKFDKSSKGYACCWNGRVFLWKLYGNGGNIYCTEGISELGRKVAQFDDKSNTLTIDLNCRLVNKDDNNNNVNNNNNNNNVDEKKKDPYSSSPEKTPPGKSNKENGEKDENDIESFETFLLLTGLIAKNSSKRLQSAVNRMSTTVGDATLNLAPFFLCCGIIQFG